MNKIMVIEVDITRSGALDEMLEYDESPQRGAHKQKT